MFEPCGNTIYLKDIYDSFNSIPDAIIHEAAHLLHYSLDDNISKAWVERFPIKREKDWDLPRMMIENGLVTSYAGFDYNLDTSKSVPRVETIRSDYTSYNRSGVEILIYSKDNLVTENDVKHVFNKVSSIPTSTLSNLVKRVIVNPKLNSLAKVSIENLTLDFFMCTEDVAESTRVFHRALSSNDLPIIGHVHALLYGEFKNIGFASDKIKLLCDYGFLSTEHANNLLCESFLFDKLRESRKHIIKFF